MMGALGIKVNGLGMFRIGFGAKNGKARVFSVDKAPDDFPPIEDFSITLNENDELVSLSYKGHSFEVEDQRKLSDYDKTDFFTRKGILVE